MKLQRAAPSLLVDLRKLRELRGIEKADGHGGVRIGVMAVLSDVAANPMVRDGYAALVEAIESIGDPQVRNRATLGGSMLARAQGADIPPVLLAYDAVLTVAGTRGDRLAPVEGLVNDPHESLLGAGELATWIDIPEASGGSAYEKFKNPANCYAICGVASGSSAPATAR
ncbi:MAG: FAD binding domain-containing protein [Chloroflexia bacterium]